MKGQEAEDQSLYFILALVVLALVFVMLPNQNLYAAVKNNLTYDKLIVQSAGGAAVVSAVKSGAAPNYVYTYTVDVSPLLDINPALKSGQGIIPVIHFKDTYVKTAAIAAQDVEGKNYERTVTVQSTVPPIGTGSNPATFVNGQVCVFRTSGRSEVFTASLLGTSERPTSLSSPLSSTCRAKFILYCNGDQKVSDYLAACPPEGSHADCYESLTLCGVPVDLTVHSVDCQQGTATADIVPASDMPIWKDVLESVTVQYFLKSDCTTGTADKDLSTMLQLCAQDFLGAGQYDAPLIGGASC